MRGKMITFKEYVDYHLFEVDAPPPAGGAPPAPPAGGGAPPPPDLGGGAGGGGAPPDMGGGMDMGLGGSLGAGGAGGGETANTKLLASDVWEALEKYLDKLDKNKNQLQNQQSQSNMA